MASAPNSFSSWQLVDCKWKKIMVDKIKRFEDLLAWQKAQDLAVEIYKFSKDFPTDERFALTNQIRRASSSVSANIAEGFGRTSNKDELRFYSMAYGSLLETKNFIYLAQRLEYIKIDSNITNNIESCQKILNGLIKSIKNE